MRLAETYGTPLYLYDRATLDDAASRYRNALSAHYAGVSQVAYASKAFFCLAMAAWVKASGLWLDCTGAGELHVAAVAGFPKERLLVHGVSKSDEDLSAAVEQAGTIVVDNLAELQRLVSLKASASHGRSFPHLWLRMRPGVAVDTHAYTQTGQEESKFGMGAVEILQALELARRHALQISGIHFHLGSHFHDPDPLGPALETVLDLLVEIRAQSGWLPHVISPGGGWGVPYHEDDLPHPSIGEYISFVAQRLKEGCQRRQLKLPQLFLEPGRSLVARAGVAIYRVNGTKETRNHRWYLIDGGLADNPRPALYGAAYTALPVIGPRRFPTRGANIAGPYCESGDVLIYDLPLPELVSGEFIAVPVSGAYQLTMGSNYNGARKPAVIWLDQGEEQLIQRRESLSDLISRDLELHM